MNKEMKLFQEVVNVLKESEAGDASGEARDGKILEKVIKIITTDFDRKNDHDRDICLAAMALCARGIEWLGLPPLALDFIKFNGGDHMKKFQKLYQDYIFLNPVEFENSIATGMSYFEEITDQCSF